MGRWRKTEHRLVAKEHDKIRNRRPRNARRIIKVLKRARFKNCPMYLYECNSDTVHK